MQENKEPITVPQIKPDETIDKSMEEESILLPKESESPVPSDPSLIENQPIQATVTPKSPKKPKIWLIVLLTVLVLIVLAGIQGLFAYKKAQKLISSVQKLSDVTKAQDITAVKTQIVTTKNDLKGLQGSVKGLFWVKVIPFIGSYVSDADHALAAGGYGLDALEITVQTAEPYMTILGFGKDGQVQDGTKTTQERLDFVVKAIPDLVPKIDEIAQKISLAQENMAFINTDRYPLKIGKMAVREPLTKALDLFNQIATFITQSKPLLEVAPYLLGIDSTRSYLVLFQNDTELRPTGGFLTAYSTMKVDKAKFEPTASNDIYNLDLKYTATLPVPGPIAKHISQPYSISKTLRLRDMNWSPDFYESMKIFLPEAQKAGVGKVDGIIAVDTKVLVNLLDVIGSIGVPGFGNFSSKIDPACNCASVIYELEKFADVEGPIVWFNGKIVFQPKNADNRKKIIGPLMNSILANAMGQPKEKLPALFEALFKSLNEKHVLFYLTDTKAQAAAEAFGMAGRIKDYPNGDYLHINDANLAGRKSNLYVTQEVDQKYEIVNGEIVKTVTITYKNPAKEDGWLNTVLPDWVRIYVSKGSRLIAAEGLEEKAEPYEDLGKTVFAGFFELRPEGVAKVTFKYAIPIKASKDFKILIQKQPGTDSPLYTIETGKQNEEFYLKTDQELKLKI